MNDTRMTSCFLSGFPKKLSWLPFWIAMIGALAGFQGVARADSGPSTPSCLAARALLLDAARAGDKICAVGERGHVLLSSDQGRTWSQAIVPTQATLTGVFFADPGNGWAVGHDAVILKTSDSAKTWTKVHEDPGNNRPLLDVWFKTKAVGFAIGAYGLCLKTLDSGRTWKKVLVSPEEWHLNRMTQTLDGILYIAAEAGQVYRSGDNGASWQALSSPYEGSFFGLLALEGDAVLVFGLRGNAFKITQGGRHWEKLATGTQATLADGLRLEDGRVVLVGLAGTVLLGHPPLTGFSSVPGCKREGLWSVLPGPGDGLICFGDMGTRQIQLTQGSQSGVHLTQSPGDLP